MAETELTYEDFGFRTGSPGPIRCRQGDMRVFVLRGSRECLQSLTDRTLNGAGGGTKYQVVGARVVLVTGNSLARSLAKPWAEWGSVPENLVAFFVPVWAGRGHHGHFHAERLCMSVPFILVDNPISHFAGREIYGFAKALGRFVEESHGGLRVSGFGGDYHPDAIACWVPVLSTAPVAGEGDDFEEVSPRELVMDFVRALGLDESLDGGDDVEIQGVITRTIRELLDGRLRLVFLKQFRDVVQPGAACYREVIEVPAQVEGATPGRTGAWSLTVERVDTHPIEAELGVGIQEAEFSAQLRDFQFTVGDMSVVTP